MVTLAIIFAFCLGIYVDRQFREREFDPDKVVQRVLELSKKRRAKKQEPEKEALTGFNDTPFSAFKEGKL